VITFAGQESGAGRLSAVVSCCVQLSPLFKKDVFPIISLYARNPENNIVSHALTTTRVYFQAWVM
jgi:hypothetical protein